MAGISVDIEDRDIQRLIRIADKGVPLFRTSVKRVIYKYTMLITAEVKRNLSKSGSGRVYEKYNPRRTHQASAPGEPPASDTGNLRSGVHALLAGLAAEIAVQAGYADDLEFGAGRLAPGTTIGISLDNVASVAAGTSLSAIELGTSRMAPRPFVRPALEKYKNDFRNELIRTLRGTF